jgi:hypothetical protein
LFEGGISKKKLLALKYKFFEMFLEKIYLKNKGPLKDKKIIDKKS